MLTVDQIDEFEKIHEMRIEKQCHICNQGIAQPGTDKYLCKMIGEKEMPEDVIPPYCKIIIRWDKISAEKVTPCP